MSEYQSPFIDDGMEGEFTIDAVDGHWSAVKVRYRPFCQAEESAVMAKAALTPGVGTGTYYAELCATKIRAWDMKDREGNPVPITPQNICKLDSLFFELLREKLRQPVQQPKN